MLPNAAAAAASVAGVTGGPNGLETPNRTSTVRGEVGNSPEPSMVSSAPSGPSNRPCPAPIVILRSPWARKLISRSRASATSGLPEVLTPSVLRTRIRESNPAIRLPRNHKGTAPFISLHSLSTACRQGILTRLRFGSGYLASLRGEIRELQAKLKVKVEMPKDVVALQQQLMAARTRIHNLTVEKNIAWRERD